MLTLGTSFSSERNYMDHLNAYACWLSSQRKSKKDYKMQIPKASTKINYAPMTRKFGSNITGLIKGGPCPPCFSKSRL